MTHTTKHTPGPWNVTHKSIIPRVYGPDDNLIAEIHPQRRRDAHLISAAPAMYEALRALVEVFPSVVKMTPYGVPMSISKIHDNAVAALAQAEARS